MPHLITTNKDLLASLKFQDPITNNPIPQICAERTYDSQFAHLNKGGEAGL